MTLSCKGYSNTYLPYQYILKLPLVGKLIGSAMFLLELYLMGHYKKWILQEKLQNTFQQ